MHFPDLNTIIIDNIYNFAVLSVTFRMISCFLNQKHTGSTTFQFPLWQSTIVSEIVCFSELCLPRQTFTFKTYSCTVYHYLAIWTSLDFGGVAFLFPYIDRKFAILPIYNVFGRLWKHSFIEHRNIILFHAHENEQLPLKGILAIIHIGNSSVLLKAHDLTRFVAV